MIEWDGPGGRYRVWEHKDVYKPSHDTFLLAHAVGHEVRPGDRFVEVGCGAGLVAMVAARRGAAVTATDLNPEAVRLAQENAGENRLAVDVRRADLLAGLMGPFDVVAFNPPYLPTAPEEMLPGPLNLAFDGGRDGNETVLRFAAQVAELEPRPRAILVVHSSLADPNALEGALGRLGYVAQVVAEEAHFFERIQVRRFARDAGNVPVAS
ncbi:MAG: HemK2/MTQ2 family protein methyltransferase [Thermoplasmatota archaeon]